MKIRSALSIAWTTLFVAVGAAAVPYEGELTSSVPRSGTVGGFSWLLDIGTEVDFWRIHADAGQFINIAVTRETDGLIPAFTLYLGTTDADPAAFRHQESWGGLTFLLLEPVVPAAAGDPIVLNYQVAATGAYTLAVGGLFSTSPGQGNYDVCAKVLAVHTGHDSVDSPCDLIPNPMPDPPTMLLLVAALLSAAAIRLHTLRMVARARSR